MKIWNPVSKIESDVVQRVFVGAFEAFQRPRVDVDRDPPFGFRVERHPA